jgi:hypothetical protein
MRKKWYLVALSLICSGLVAFFINFTGSIMQLVNVKTGFVVVEYKGKKTLFHDRFLEQSMKKHGILIPPFKREDFAGKTVVRLSDKDFQKAFKEIYYPFSMSPQTYQWQEDRHELL